jgi:hypothetical protein
MASVSALSGGDFNSLDATWSEAALLSSIDGFSPTESSIDFCSSLGVEDVLTSLPSFGLEEPIDESGTFVPSWSLALEDDSGICAPSDLLQDKQCRLYISRYRISSICQPTTYSLHELCCTSDRLEYFPFWSIKSVTNVTEEYSFDCWLDNTHTILLSRHHISNICRKRII